MNKSVNGNADAKQAEELDGLVLLHVFLDTPAHIQVLITLNASPGLDLVAQQPLLLLQPRHPQLRKLPLQLLQQHHQLALPRARLSLVSSA